MKKITHIYSNPKQAVLPILIQDYLDICDPVLIFDRFMGEIDLEKYLKEILCVGDTVLFKGSRVMKLEEVANKFN